MKYNENKNDVFLKYALADSDGCETNLFLFLTAKESLVSTCIKRNRNKGKLLHID